MPFRLRRATSVVVLLVAALVATPTAVVAADPLPPAQLSLAAPTSGKAGLPATFTLTLLDDTSAPLPGATVTLQRLDGTTWRSAAHGLTTSDGTLALQLKLPLGTSRWRGVYAGDTGHGADSTDPVSVVGRRYATGLQLAGPSRVVDERSITLTARWTASDGSGVQAPLRLDRRTGQGRWTAYRTLRTGPDGRATVTLTPRVDTAYRVVGGAGSWWLAAASAVKTVDNLPPGVPVVLPAKAPRPAYTSPQARATRPGADVVVTAVPDSVWRSMVGRTWHSGCPVGRSGLRLLRVNYWGFDGYRYRGEMVLSSAVVRRAGAAFADMYEQKLPIRRMFRVDRFGWSQKLHGGNDYASMNADNTSGFNCRSVVNKPGVLSPHARGRAVDLNTWENPYRSATGLVPNAWWASHSHPRVAWRSSSHPVVRIWRAHGFHWTYGNVDSQHVDGRHQQLLGGFTG